MPLESHPPRPALSLPDILAAFRKAIPTPPPPGSHKGARPRSRTPQEWVFQPPKTRNGASRLSRLFSLPLHPSWPSARRLTRAEIAPFTFGLEACRLVFVDGHFCQELSFLSAPGGDTSGRQPPGRAGRPRPGIGGASRARCKRETPPFSPP